MSNITQKPTQSKTEDKPVRKVGTNSSKLPFPQDRGGITQELRRGGVRAIGRIAGNEDALETVLQTLEVLADYARERCEEQKQELANRRARIQERADIEAKVAADALKLDLKRKQDAVKRAQDELKQVTKAVKKS